MKQGQDRELYCNLSLTGEVLHFSTLATPKNGDPKKRQTDTKGTKSAFERGWCRRFEKKKSNTPLDAEFSPIVYLAFPSFHRAPYHWTTIIPSYGFPNRAGKKQWGY
jgi:hypothetical protein